MAHVQAATPPNSSHDQSPRSTDSLSWSSVPVLTNLPDREFTASYRDAMRPVLLSGGCAAWAACKRWSPQYFDETTGSLKVPVKTYGNSGEIKVTSWSLGEYARFILKR